MIGFAICWCGVYLLPTSSWESVVFTHYLKPDQYKNSNNNNMSCSLIIKCCPYYLYCIWFGDAIWGGVWCISILVERQFDGFSVTHMCFESSTLQFVAFWHAVCFSHEKADGIAVLYSFHMKFDCIVDYNSEKTKGFDARGRNRKSI